MGLLLLDWCQRVDLSAKCLSIWDKFNGMVPFLLIQEFVEGLFSKNVFELLVRLGHYILEACHAGPLCGFHQPLGDNLSGLDLFQVFANEAYKELVTLVQIVQIRTCKAWWWLGLVG